MLIQIWWQNIFESGHLKTVVIRYSHLDGFNKYRIKPGNWMQLVQDVIKLFVLVWMCYIFVIHLAIASTYSLQCIANSS
jgi:hypothetical protein